MMYFATSVFLSAFLLFQVQPMIGKLLLPWFGGTPAVWSSVLLFFQLLLIGGYAYAYWLIRAVSQRKQCIVHMSLLVIAGLCIAGLSSVWPSPITPGLDWRPQQVDSPIGHIFILLTISVGLPYFILATNAPLMQAWFSSAYPQRSPYRLYSLSNVGSLLALISYPFLIEPLFSLHTQGDIWSVLFIGFILLVAYILRLRMQVVQSIPVSSATAMDASYVAPGWGVQLLWIAFSACASIMLMAVTNQITQETAAVPFLWVLPLILYLLSFILTFHSEHWYDRLLFSFLLLVASIQLVGTLVFSAMINVLSALGGYGFLLFVCCMVCNGELFRLRPHAVYLTRFYVMLAIGGAIGGVLVNFVAPHIFTGYWELEWGVGLCWLLLLIIIFVRPLPLKKRMAVLYPACVWAITILVFAFAVQGILYLQTHSLLAVRNFYGVLRVKEAFKEDPQKHIYTLLHGITSHGAEFVSPQKRDQKTYYYFPKSGIGLAITQHPQYGKGMHVGILGLGIGGLAAYGQTGDTYRFYEINPAIVSIATGQNGYFHFIQDSRAKIDIILGDARISLEKEWALGQKQRFDILAMDAFSSDAIPVHLVTKEVFAVYLAHLAENGVLAVHISNRSLDMQPALWQLAAWYHLGAVQVDATSPDFHITSSWILMSYDASFLSRLVDKKYAYWLNAENTKPARMWTDDYSNLLQMVR